MTKRPGIPGNEFRDPTGIRGLFEGGLGPSYGKLANRLATRYFAAQEGFTLRKEDNKKDEIATIQSEFIAFSGGMTLAEYKSLTEAYRMPKGSVVDANGFYDRAEIQKFAASVACSKLFRINDLTNSAGFTSHSERKGGGKTYISFDGDTQTTKGSNKIKGYELERLIYAVLASREIQRVSSEIPDLHYPHVDLEGRITEKTFFVLNDEMAKNLEIALAKAKKVEKFQEKKHRKRN